MNAPSSTRYLSVWLERLATDRITRSVASIPRSVAPSCVAPDDAEHALVVVAPIKSALRLTAMNEAAARLGLKVGMALADARAMHPRLVVADADPVADQHLLGTIADWCDRYTPLVGLHPPDGLILDISGCAHLFGGEAALGGDLIRRLRRHGFAARAAIADTVGCAWAVARYGEAEALSLAPPPPDSPEASHLTCRELPTSPWRGEVAGRRPAGGGECSWRSSEEDGEVSRYHPARFARRPSPSRGGWEQADSSCLKHCLLIPSGEMRAALAPLPVAALRLAPEVVTLLAQVGLKRIADLLDRPRAALAARFGTELIRRLDQALGTDAESIAPRQPLPRYVAEQRFADPIALERDVLGTIQRLGGRLKAALERHGEGARLVEVVLFRVDGKVLRLSAATSRPIRDAALVRRLFAERLAAIGDAHDPGFGFDMIRLSVIVSEPLMPQQTGFNDSDHSEDLSQLIDRLGARFGSHCVRRLMPHDTHIPEFAVVEIRADQTTDDRGQRTEIDLLSVCPPSSVLRPLTLFERPEPIEAVAEVPDGPPVRFRWRHVLHEVAIAEGPERLAMEWWRDATGLALTRDYFRIESREGARFWVYREGLYQRETAQPRWFMHGLFA